MAEKKGVIILYKYLDLLAKLPLEDQGRILQASIKFDMTGELPTLENPAADMLFAVMVKDFEAMSENWQSTVEARGEAGKKGMQVRWHNKNNKEDFVITPDNKTDKEDFVITPDNKTDNNDSDHDSDHDHEREKRNSEDPSHSPVLVSEKPSPDPVSVLADHSPSPSFSVSDQLYPGKIDVVNQVEAHRKTWEKFKLPSAQIITNITVLNDLKDTLFSFTDALIDEAIHNYAELLAQPWFDESVLPGGKRPAGFKNFMQRWIGYFINDNKPFETYRPRVRATSPPKNNGPDWGGAVDLGKPVKAKPFFEGGDS